MNNRPVGGSSPETSSHPDMNNKYILTVAQYSRPPWFESVVTITLVRISTHDHPGSNQYSRSPWFESVLTITLVRISTHDRPGSNQYSRSPWFESVLTITLVRISSHDHPGSNLGPASLTEFSLSPCSKRRTRKQSMSPSSHIHLQFIIHSNTIPFFPDGVVIQARDPAHTKVINPRNL
jgi:hypothetical protein